MSTLGPMTPGGAGWKTLKIGGGGFVTGMDIAPTGEMAVRTDTYGAYVWVPADSAWRQVVTSDTLPEEDVVLENGTGVFEIRMAPSNPDRLYMLYGVGTAPLYRSDDFGVTWTKLEDFTPIACDPNASTRLWGPKMMVDPVNPDVVYVGTPVDGLWVTTDGGSNWTHDTGVPTAASIGYNGMLFDPNSATSGGRKQTAYVNVAGSGTYRTTNGGSSWSLLSGGPTTTKHACIAADGIYYCVDGNAVHTWKYNSGWTEITQNDDDHAIACDPNDSARLISISSGGHAYESLNRGTSWTNLGMQTMGAGDVPWLSYGYSAGDYMSSADLLFDPLVQNKLWIPTGAGVEYSTITPSMGTPPVWYAQAAGIEGLVANTICAVPGGKPLCTAWDFKYFYIDDPDVYRDQFYPVLEFNRCSAMDYASGSSGFVAGLIGWGSDFSGYSSDNGLTWTQFAAIPPEEVVGGCIAVSTPDNMVWVQPDSRAPYYTTDGGDTWNQISLPGITNWSGLHWNASLNRHLVTPDRVNTGTFYMYDSGDPDIPPAFDGGVFRSTDGGANWSRMSTGEITQFSYYNVKLRSVPGKAGHLFFCGGLLSGDHPGTTQYFKRSQDGGATWTTISNVLEVAGFGFGKAADGASYPTIFIAGHVNSIWGFWRSTDEGATWTQFGTWPMGSLASVTYVEGDPDTFGTCYVATSGNGFMYYKL